MTNPIVTVLVAQQNAPAPSALQKTGALISQGATNLAANATALLTQLSDLTALLLGTIPLASLTQAGGLATATMESTTISSGTYTSSTGEVSLTLAASIGVQQGDLANVTGATGSGQFSAIDGTWPLLAGSGGTTINFPIQTGLSLGITGGNIAATLGLAIGATFLVTISGAAQAGYNGTFVATITGVNTFTFPVPSATASPATGSPAMTPGNQAELVEMATTFFDQGAAQGIYVLELGAGTPAAGVTALSSYISNNIAPSGNGPFYSYVIPRSWDGVASFLTFLAGFKTTTSKTYFFVITTLATYADYTGLKCVLAFKEAPGVTANEFDTAALAQITLNYAPASTNRVTPLNFAFLSDVTPYPTSGNGPTLASLNAANVNFAQTGSQAGLSDTILIGGNMMDGNPFNYWYSVDWVQINAALNITNALVNGSNNPVNPLYYDQDGINALQTVLVSTMGTGIADGLVLNPIKATQLSAAQLLAAIDAGTFDGYTLVNADPFASYVAENPSDYPAGIYRGFTIVYTPLRGFTNIVINVLVSNFATG